MTNKKETVKKPVMKLIEGTKAIDTAIKSIASRGKTLERDIHVAAVSTLNHAELHGDVTLAQRLVEAVPSLARKNALRDWFLAFGKFSYDEKNKTLAYNKAGVTLLDEAIATPFWDFKPEAPYVPFDMNAAIQKLIQRAEKAVSNGDNVPSETLDALRKLTV